MAGPLLKFKWADPTQRVATPRRPWLVLGQNLAFFPKASRLVLSGAAGAYISTPDSAALDVLSGAGASYEVRCLLAPTQWAPPGLRGIAGQGVNQNGTAGDQTFQWQFQGSGARALQMNLENAAGTGMTFTTGGSTPAGFTDGSERWLSASFINASGKLWFNYSTDGVSWTPDARTGIAPGAIPVSAQPLRVGATHAAGTLTFAGYIKRFELRAPCDASGNPALSGPIVAGFDARQAQIGGTTLRGLAGELWTLQGAGAGASFQ